MWEDGTTASVCFGTVTVFHLLTEMSAQLLPPDGSQEQVLSIQNIFSVAYTPQLIQTFVRWGLVT